MLTPAQLATTWTWMSTGVSTIVKNVDKKKVTEAAVKVITKG